MTKLAIVFVIAACLPAVVRADDLTPAQDEARIVFEEETSNALGEMNAQCGTKAAITVDWKNFKPAAWERGIQPQALCKLVVTEIGYMCRDRPPYKKALAKQLKGVSCVFAGVQPKQKKDGTNDFTRRNMSFAKGRFTLRMHGELVNVEDNTKFTVEKTIGGE